MVGDDVLSTGCAKSSNLIHQANPSICEYMQQKCKHPRTKNGSVPRRQKKAPSTTGPVSLIATLAAATMSLRQAGSHFFLCNATLRSSPSLIGPRFFTTNFVGTTKSTVKPAQHGTLLSALQSTRPSLGQKNREFTSLFRQASDANAKRTYATHRELGYSSGAGGGYWGRLWRNVKYPLLFAGAVVAVNHFVLPWAFNLPGLSTLRRRPDYVVYGLMAVNAAGFLAWKVGGRAGRFMYRYGLLHKDRQFNTWQMLGSAFSHQEWWHIGLNMFVLYQFGMPVARWMGSDQFLAAYMDGAVLSSLGSIMFPLVARTFVNVPSLGASGAVFGIFGIFSYLAPHAKLALFFVPLPIGAWGVFLATVAYNTAGIFYRFGGSDYAGHVAGSLVGWFWGWLISERIRRARARARAASQHGFIRW